MEQARNATTRVSSGECGVERSARMGNQGCGRGGADNMLN